MATKFTKEKIDFDVYERQDPASQVDWGKAAADITKTVAGIRDERVKRKGEIDKAFEDQQTALTDIGKYDNVTLQQLVMNGYQDAANKTTDIQNLVRRGLMKPSEAKLFRHNTMTGMNLLKKNAVQYDVSFKDYTERLASGEGAAGEEWGAGELEGFANINDLQVQTDPVTGNVVQLRVDPKTGEPIPGESLSVQHMTVLLNQRMDAMDMTAEVTDVNKAVGDVILAQRKTAGITDILTSQEMTRLSAEYLADGKNKDFLNAKIDLVLQDPFKKQDMLVKNVTTNGKPDGESYYIGKQETHDQWNVDNPGQEELNPVLVMGFGDDSQRKAEFTEAQDKRAKEHVKVQLIGAQDYKEDIETKKIEKNVQPQPNQATLNAGKEDDAKSSKLGDYIVMLTDPDPVKRAAIEKTLNKTKNDAVDAFNAKVSNDEDKLPKINNISKGTEKVATQEDVDNGLAENIGDKFVTNRVIKLSDGTEIQLEGSFTDQTRTLEALYDPNNQLTTDDIEKLAKGRDFDLNTEITNKGDSTKTSKKAYAATDYTTDIQIEGKSDRLSAQAHMDEVFGGLGGSGQFNSAFDSAKEIGEEMIKIINGTIDPDMLREFNTTTGMELSFTSSKDGDDSVTFNFGGESFTVGGKNGDLNAGDLYGGNGADLWQALQDNLLNPAIKKLNDGRTGGGKNYEL